MLVGELGDVGSLACMFDRDSGDVAVAIRRVREHARPPIAVQVECDTPTQVRAAVAERAESVLLDNMPLDVLRECVAIARGTCVTEASGGVRLETPHRLEVGGVPTLVLSIPGGDAMMLSAEVLEAREDGGGWVCRLAFRDLRPRDRQRLGAFVDGTVAIRPGGG